MEWLLIITGLVMVILAIVLIIYELANDPEIFGFVFGIVFAVFGSLNIAIGEYGIEEVEKEFSVETANTETIVNEITINDNKYILVEDDTEIKTETEVIVNGNRYVLAEEPATTEKPDEEIIVNGEKYILVENE